MYHPDFPGGSPFITVVGGTDFVTKGTIGPEKTWTAGGGGFSNTFGTPTFQTDAVAGYLKAAGAQGILPPQVRNTFHSISLEFPPFFLLGNSARSRKRPL